MAVHYGIDPLWAALTNQGRTHIATTGINQTGLVFNIDLGTTSSYPGSGTTLFDLKQNQNLSLVNTPLYSASATDYYGALVFDGVNEYGQATSLPLNSPLSLTTNFTIEQVFKPTAYQASNYFGITNVLISKGPASTYNYATQVTTDTTVSFIKRDNAESLQFHTFTVPSMLNKINVLSFVIENGNNTSIDTVKCYHNGEFISSMNIAGNLIAAYANDTLYLGGLGATQYTNFTGSYYSCRIYNRALSATEITKNFNTIRRRYNL